MQACHSQAAAPWGHPSRPAPQAGPRGRARRAAAPLPAPAPTSEQRSGSWPHLPPLVAQTEHCTRPGRPALCCVETAGGCGVEMRCVASFSNTPARQGGHQVFNCDNVSVGAWIMTGSVPHPRRYGGCFLFSKLRPLLLQLVAFTASSHSARAKMTATLLNSLDRDTLTRVLCLCSCRDVLALACTCRELHVALQVIYSASPGTLITRRQSPAHHPPTPPANLPTCPSCLHRRTTCCGSSWQSRNGVGMCGS